MPITVTCDTCSDSHRVKDDEVEMKIKCKGSGKLLAVEVPASSESDFSNCVENARNDDTGHDIVKTLEASSSEQDARESMTNRPDSERHAAFQFVLKIYFAALLAGIAYVWKHELGLAGLLLLVGGWLILFLPFGLVLIHHAGRRQALAALLTRPPEYSADSLICRASRGRDRPMSVIVDRSAGMIHFQNCAARWSFWPRSCEPWLSCTLSDLRSWHTFHDRGGGSVVVITTDVGRLTVDARKFQEVVRLMDDILPGCRRRFHEDHPLAVLLTISAAACAVFLTFVVIPETWYLAGTYSLVLGAGAAAWLTVQWIISARGKTQFNDTSRSEPSNHSAS